MAEKKGVKVTESKESKMTVSTAEAASEALMKGYTFLTVEETDEIWYYKDAAYIPGGKILIAKESEKMFGCQLNNKNLVNLEAFFDLLQLSKMVKTCSISSVFVKVKFCTKSKIRFKVDRVDANLKKMATR